MEAKRRVPFENHMTKTQTVLGWVYLPLHVLAFPVLFSLYAAVSPDGLTEMDANVIYYAVGAAFVLIAMFRFLRDGFDQLLDRLRFCLATLLLAFLLDYALSYAATLLLLLVEETVENPNNAEVLRLAGTDYGAMKAMGIFAAPLVEEVLFRGTVFGSIRRRSRVWAYVASAVLFGLYHVWQYAVVYADAAQLLYAIQYIPISIVLAWCYERTGSIWTPIFFHMGVNALSFALLG